MSNKYVNKKISGNKDQYYDENKTRQCNSMEGDQKWKK